MKVLVLQTLYNLSDEQMEYQIKDRLSFMRFLGLCLHERIPDAKTIWLYRERLKGKKVMNKLFKSFDEQLKAKGYIAMEGQIVDASIVQAPRQRMTKDEKEDIKQGKAPEEWETNPHKKGQKDRDARWTVKYTKAKPREDGTKPVDLAIPSYGYKNHIGIDKRHGMIRTYEVTDAASHDGKHLPDLLDEENTASGVWADTAYKSAANEAYMAQKGFTSHVHRKKLFRKEMPEVTKRANNKRSKIRAKVEHVFAHMKHHGKLFIRTIGLERAKVKIGLANLVYNMKRFIYWELRMLQRG